MRLLFEQNGCLLFGLLMALTTQLLLSKQSLNAISPGMRSPLFSCSSGSAFCIRRKPKGRWVAVNHPPRPPPTEWRPPPPMPPRRRPPSPPAPQPDDVRLRMEQQAAPLSEMKCGEPIPPESISTTTDGDRAMTIHTRAVYKGVGDEDRLHAWSYSVDFVNQGRNPVQLLTRHWVFIDSNGKTEEIKGPGARGALPIIPPGGRWDYSSGTRLASNKGSMHGWFTFEDLAANELFATRVNRLALSSEGSSELVPCASAADAGKLPPTSVHSTDRVLVGAIATLQSADQDVRRYTFLVDLQINNARSEPVSITGVQWRIVDASGTVSESHSTVGDAGGLNKAIKLGPQGALRLKSQLPPLGTPTAKISGHLLARFGEPDDEGAEDEPVREILVGTLGASVDGSAVPPYEPLGFLEQRPQSQPQAKEEV